MALVEAPVAAAVTVLGLIDYDRPTVNHSCMSFNVRSVHRIVQAFFYV